MFDNVITTFYALIPSNNLIGGAKVIPSDFKGKATAPFARVHFVLAPTKLASYTGSKELRGLLKISIFAKSGAGDKYFATLANNLDTIFEKKLLANDIQTYTSSLQFLGPDSVDATLSRADYTVPFSYYGE